MKVFLTFKCLNCLIRSIGEIAQSVEQRIENPCVPSSILGLATIFKDFIHDPIMDFFWVKNTRSIKKEIFFIDY